MIGTITEFPLPTASFPFGITAGSDGNLWFTEGAPSIGRITPTGVLTEFPFPTANSQPNGITAGPDGNLWFTEDYIYWENVGRITLSGTVTEFPLSIGVSSPAGITAGPDGNLWFTEAVGDKIGRITPGGIITEFPLPGGPSEPFGITAGPDGNLWFTEASTNRIGRISPSGTITEFPLPTANSAPLGITTGPDGNLWFAEYVGNQIGRITPNGTVTEFPLPYYSHARGVTAGPDGNLWFTAIVGNKIGRITPSGTVTEFPLPTANSQPNGITAGPDGNIWFTESNNNRIGQLLLNSSPTPTPSPTPVGNGIPNPPTQVSATGGGLSNWVTVKWQPPPSGPPPTQYNILWTNTTTHSQSQQTVDAYNTQFSVGGLDNCTQYTFAVQSGSPGGWGAFSADVLATPYIPISYNQDGSPSYAVILLSGVSTGIDEGIYVDPVTKLPYPSGQYPPLGLGAATYCFGSDGGSVPTPLGTMFGTPNQGILGIWTGDVTPTTLWLPLQLAAVGAVILPFSYNGAYLMGDQSNPASAILGFRRFLASDSGGDVSPDSAADYLGYEVSSINRIWPSTRIVIVGHSNGGLVAELWWQKYGTHQGSISPNGVGAVFSLDSPIGGNLPFSSVGAFCLPNALFCAAVAKIFAQVSPAQILRYTDRWLHQSTNEQTIVNLDGNGQYIPVGTIGDPLYSVLDYPCDSMYSQILVDQGCGFSFSPSNPAGFSMGSDCRPGWMLSLIGHSFVKNCDNVVNYIACLLIAQPKGCTPRTYNAPWPPRPPAVTSSAGATSRTAMRNAAPSPTLNSGRARPGPLSSNQTWPTWVVGKLVPSVLSPGQSATITGSGFGSVTGQVQFIDATSGIVSAVIGTWTDTQVTLTVPTTASTGPVALTTAATVTSLVGMVTILSPANGVVSIQATQVGAPPLDFQSAVVSVKALDAQNQPILNATVGLSSGIGAMTAQTDSSGSATFTLTGLGSQSYVAYSGATYTQVSVVWQQPPVMSLSMAASTNIPAPGAPVVVTITLKDASGHPVPSQPVSMHASGPSTLTLSSTQVMTNGAGSASITVTNTGSGPFAVSATANDYATTGYVVIRPVGTTTLFLPRVSNRATAP